MAYLGHDMSWLRDFFGQFQVWGASPRSPKWRALRDRFVAENPFCAGCGVGHSLEVHHLTPFHARPDLELDESNLVVVCRDCHWNCCHLRDWSLHNKFCLDDLRAYRQRFTDARLK